MRSQSGKEDGLPHQSADWFAMTFFLRRSVDLFLAAGERQGGIAARGVQEAAPYGWWKGKDRAGDLGAVSLL